MPYKAVRELRGTIQGIYIKAHGFNRQANAKQRERLQGKYTMGSFYHSDHAGASAVALVCLLKLCALM